ncbi:uncharacterized protein LOC124837151 [Vigna umbellata]|uniref:uncharacterized protein LOC124837151 n=1 Tax=Vigna umbellata TaxID=87088 RepID=UPI001F5F2EFB|nr:uncharacterized protein LOC124837151 [Vigna umbellata]
MDVRNIAVVVEDVDAARTALQWALHNIIRYGDIITLLHVYPLTRSKTKNKARLLRLKGFQLALSFQQDIYNNFSNTKVEIVVTEDNREGMKIVATVRCDAKKELWVKDDEGWLTQEDARALNSRQLGGCLRDLMMEAVETRDGSEWLLMVVVVQCELEGFVVLMAAFWQWRPCDGDLAMA